MTTSSILREREKTEMAACALGLPSAARFAASADGLLPSPSPSPAPPPSPPSHSARLSFPFSPHALRSFPAISSCAATSGSFAAGNALFRVRSSLHASTEVAEPSSSPSQASPSSSSPSSSADQPPIEAGPATIDLEFLGLEQGQDGLPKADKVSVESGEKLLRTIMNKEKLELYGLYGKIMNCGGGGSCGTCIVEVLEGSDLLNERTDAEERYLKKKPSTWRLACQTIVGDKTNAGKVVVQRLPQKKQ